MGNTAGIFPLYPMIAEHAAKHFKHGPMHAGRHFDPIDQTLFDNARKQDAG
jgi:hypothetical protein